MWLSNVFTEILSLLAVSRYEYPLAMRLTTSLSLGVSRSMLEPAAMSSSMSRR
jgi:hypothetical protein